ncbi:MAG: hypothetical protein V4671_04655 [Armatimonadota bacterium]
MAKTGLFDFDDDLPLSAAAQHLVSVALAALSWAEEPLRPGQPRPRKTVEEKVIGNEYRRLVQVRQQTEERKQQAAERDKEHLYRGLTEIACAQVGVEYGEVEVPLLPADYLERAEKAEAEADPENLNDARARRLEAINVTNRAIWDGNTRKERVIGSNRVSNRLVG